MDRLGERYGKKLVAVVDACQGRMGELAVREHLDKGRVVLTTGSKFFGGPPFSGVCLMPRALAEELESLLSNRFVSKVLECSSLQDYVGASLMSDDLSTLRSRVPETNLNYGVLLRWTLGLYEMEAFYVDMQAEERNEIMKSWAQGT